MKLSIVVPIYNEAANIFQLHREIVNMCRNPKGCAEPFDWEIIFVDDGSDDMTPEICRQLGPLKYIRFRRNYGQTAALDCGFHKATGDYIVPLDGDGQNDPDDIPRMLQYLIDHDLDVVCGWRKKRYDSFRKKMDSRMANIVRQKMVSDGIHDSGCTLKVIRRECLDGLTLCGDQHRFIPAILNARGCKVGEIEVNHRPRLNGKSKYNYKRIFHGLRDLTEIRLEKDYDLDAPQSGGIIKGPLIRSYHRHYSKSPYSIYLDPVALRPVGEQHAVIHPWVDRIGNTGVVLEAPGAPVLFHPGDALDAEPGAVDVLAVPVNAPWGKVSETLEFVRRIAPRQGVVPVHDGLLNDTGRSMYLKHIGDFGAEGGVEVLDLRGAGTTTLGR